MALYSGSPIRFIAKPSSRIAASGTRSFFSSASSMNAMPAKESMSAWMTSSELAMKICSPLIHQAIRFGSALRARFRSWPTVRISKPRSK